MIPALFLSPLARKAMLYGAIILAVAYGVRWYSNREWSKGYDQGKQAGYVEMARQKEAEYVSQRAEIQRQAGELATEREKVNAQFRELQSSRQQLRDSLQSALQRVGASRTVENAKIDQIPPDQLDDAIRSQLRVLAVEPDR